MRGCSGCDKQPLSTLSASIEHPLGEAGEKVERVECMVQSVGYPTKKCARACICQKKAVIL